MITRKWRQKFENLEVDGTKNLGLLNEINLSKTHRFWPICLLHNVHMDNFATFLYFSFIFSIFLYSFSSPRNFIENTCTMVLQIYGCPSDNCISIFGCPATFLVVPGARTTKISNAGAKDHIVVLLEFTDNLLTLNYLHISSNSLPTLSG